MALNITIKTDRDDYAKRCTDIAHAINFVEAGLDNAPEPAQVARALRQLADDYEDHVMGPVVDLGEQVEP